MKSKYVLPRIVFVGALSITVLLGLTHLAQAGPKPAIIPDLTQGGKADDRHDWNLGPTGARGWIWGQRLETTDARQILITKVDKGSPAEGVLEPGDVILGVGDKPFDDDARKSIGRAITEAETESAGGILRLIRWRAGKQDNIQLKLAVMGTYSDTSPWDCPKSKRILDAGCRHIAENLKKGIDGRMGALALLASGNDEYLPIVKAYAREFARPDLELDLYGPTAGLVSWQWGYTNLFLTEYYLATGDEYVLPAIRKFSTTLAQGQSGVGSWGHGMAWPNLNEGRTHGRLGGYGALNQAGLVCHQSLILAKMCGVKEKEVDRAIDKANEFFGFYIGKGAIPYGDHRPGAQVHDDNGKNSIAAVSFDLQGHDAGATFFSRMTVASYGERERGHTGNYFSYLWGPLGANRAGPAAAAAFLKEQRWFYDLGRRADGSFPYQGGAGSAGSEHKYGNWDCTGAYMLAYALPQKRLYITGRGVREANRLVGDELNEVVEAGRDFSSWHLGIEPYREMTDAQLLDSLSSWSPAVRHRASVALAERETDHAAQLLALLRSEDHNGRYGACQALGALKKRGGPAVPRLVEILKDRDVWLRIQACYALSAIGEPAKQAVDDLLRLAVTNDENDPREMTQRYLAFGLFYRGGALKMVGLLGRSIEGADRELLYAAVIRLLEHPDGRARGAVGSVYNHLTYEELKPLLPYVIRAIKEPSPSGVMFSSGIRMEGLQLLAKHRIAEGMPLCLTTMEIDEWGKRGRIARCLKTLQSYGGAARPVLPQLRELKKQLESHHEARGLQSEIELIEKTITLIEADEDPPELRYVTNSADTQ